MGFDRLNHQGGRGQCSRARKTRSQCLDKFDNQGGVDNAWEQKKLEARKMLENGDESHRPALSLSKGPVRALLGGSFKSSFSHDDVPYNSYSNSTERNAYTMSGGATV